MNAEERERIVKEAWHPWFQAKYPDTLEQTGPPVNAREIIHRALLIALPPGTVAVKIEDLETIWGCADVIRHHGQNHPNGAILTILNKVWKMIEGEGNDSR